MTSFSVLEHSLSYIVLQILYLKIQDVFFQKQNFKFNFKIIYNF